MFSNKILMLLLLISLFSFAVGYATHSLIAKPTETVSSATDQQSERREVGYTLINPLLECEFSNNQGNTKLKSLRDGVEGVTAQKSNQEISVYYRDLLNGPWYGHNENAAFAPQSLLKLPVIFAYLKLADEDASVLQKKIVYSEQLDQNLPDADSLELGKEYSVEELIKRTIQLSDNEAFDLLVAHLPEKFLIKVHEDLNITYPSQSTPTDFITVRSYSSIFRVLYNSSYLSRRNSEWVLQILSESDFDDGLIAGVPEKITVAHKYGVKTANASTKLSQLHDCGIIYHPERPYVLCVMTKGTDPAQQAETIKDVSQTVYAVIDSE